VFGTPRDIGRLFLTSYLFPFEIASLLLLVAAVGAVVLARRRRGLEPTDDQFERRVHAERPVYTGTMAETTGIRRGPPAEVEIEVEPAGTTGGGSEGGW
jgi:NADH-quinone oxidoreductase subunit J